MTTDLVVTNATLPDGRIGQDIAVSVGRIVAVKSGIAAEAGLVIDDGPRGRGRNVGRCWPAAD